MAHGPVIRLDASDNIVVARTDLPIGARLDPEGMTSRSQVQAGHKIAARPIRKGEPIVKYNTIIGFAAQDIRPGTLLHRLNMEFREFERDYAFCADSKPVAMVPEAERASFMGIVRAN
ncbi:MAG TPA: UxaA family hydrolase, partial [Candidatus Methanomethylicus sp.]|nr:UxaA family hydrolase [Candidatus Methanomethylicus sp.]